MCGGVLGSQRHRLSLELESEMVVNHLMRVLGIEIGTSAQEARVLNCEPSLQPSALYFWDRFLTEQELVISSKLAGQ